LALPQLRYVEFVKDIRVSDTLERGAFAPTGNHLILGQKEETINTDALVYLGKCMEKNYYNTNVWLDVSRPHVIYIVGKRGEGKSYDLGVLAEGLGMAGGGEINTLKTAQTVLLFDTQSQFWTLKYQPNREKDIDRQQVEYLTKWGLQARALKNVQIFIPKGEEAIFTGSKEYVLNPVDMDGEDWCGLLGVDPFSPTGHLLIEAYGKVTTDGYKIVKKSPEGRIIKEEKVEPREDYDIHDLIKCIRHDEEINSDYQDTTIKAVTWRLGAAQNYPLFGKPGISLSEIVKEGYVTIFLLRNLSDEMKALVTGVIIKKIFKAMGIRRQLQRALERVEDKKEVVVLERRIRELALPVGLWVLIDEAHVMCPSDGHTASKKPIIEFVRRGRDAGLSLVMATQQPSAVDSRVLQTDLAIIHRLTTDEDINAARARLPAPFPSDIKIGGRDMSDMKDLIRHLGVGEIVCADAETSRAIIMRMRPRVSVHGGGEPRTV